MKAKVIQTATVINSPHPRVSVIIPSYNYAHYLTEAVMSVLNQTYQDFEIIIVDPISTDETPEVCRGLLEHFADKRLTVIRQENKGQPAISRNLGIARARGKFVIPLDADDKLAPDMIKECVELLENTKEVSIAYTDRLDFGDYEGIVQAGEYDFPRLRYANHISYCALYSKKIWEHVGGYRTNIRGMEDWDFWVAAGALGYYGRRIKKPLFHYRRRKGQGMFVQVENNMEWYLSRIILNNREVYEPDAVTLATDLHAIVGSNQNDGAPPSNLDSNNAKIVVEDQKVVNENIVCNEHSDAIPIFDNFRSLHKNNIKRIEEESNKLKVTRTSKISPPCYEKFKLQDELPLVSVILTTYNRQAHLKRSITSVLNQNYPNIELIVINDGGNCVKSTINELGVGGRINYLSLGLNHGLAGARNYGLRLSQGDYICFLDDDDYFERDHIISLLNEIKKQNVNVVYSNSKRIYEKNDGDKFIIEKIEDPDSACREFHPDRILIHNLMPVNTVMFSRKSFEDTGYFDETLTVHEDWDYWIRLSRKYYLHHLDKTTCAVTVRSNTMSSNQSRDFYYTMKRIHKKYSSNREEVIIGQTQMLQTVHHYNNPTTNAPLISIILYSTNPKELKYLEECIYSIINNTRSVSFEIILVTNQSDTSYQEILEYSNAKIVKLDKNINTSDAINSGAKVAMGKYIVILKPFARPKLGWARMMLNYLSTNEKNNIVLANTLYFNYNTPLGLKYNNENIEIIYNVTNKSHKKKNLSDNCLIFSDLILLKLSDFKETGGFTRDQNFYLNVYNLCSDSRSRSMNVGLTEGNTCISSYDLNEKELIHIKNEYAKMFQQIDFLSKVKIQTQKNLVKKN